MILYYLNIRVSKWYYRKRIDSKLVHGVFNLYFFIFAYYMYYIKVQSMVKLKSLDWFSKNDLFVLIKYGKQIRRTTVLWDNNDPKWNEEFIN